MKVTIEYRTDSNADRDRIATVLHSHLCGRQAYIDSLIGINIDEDRTILIWVDHQSELATGHYVGYICELLHRTRMMRVDIKYHVFDIDKHDIVYDAVCTALRSRGIYKKGVVGVCYDGGGNITFSIANLSNKRTYECINFIDGAARSVGVLLERRLVWWMPNGGSVCEEDTSES